MVHEVGAWAGSVSLSSHFGHRPAPASVGSGTTVGEGRAVRRLKQRDAAPFQKRGQGKPGGETAQMGDDGNAALGLHRCRQSKQLLDDPKAEHHEGGYIDRADEDEKPIDAAKRELFEETGYVSNDFQYLGIGRLMINRTNSIQHLFVAKEAIKNSPPKEKNTEIIYIHSVN